MYWYCVKIVLKEPGTIMKQKTIIIFPFKLNVEGQENTAIHWKNMHNLIESKHRFIS